MADDVKIVPYKAEHAIALRDGPGVHGLNFWTDFEADAKNNELAGPGYTGYVNGQIVACAGIKILREGIGEGWALFADDEHLDEYKRIVLESFRFHLEAIVRAYELRWVEAIVKTDFVKGCMFLRHLGFKRKCELEQFAPDKKDCVMYVLTR
ncbi:MAG: hypothetical protein ACYTEQ_22665 [Planctomycetota bacterium]|jgi:hypothetical protein